MNRETKKQNNFQQSNKVHKKENVSTGKNGIKFKNGNKN